MRTYTLYNSKLGNFHMLSEDKMQEKEREEK